MGAATVDLMGYPDNQFDTVPLLRLAKDVEGAIAQGQPSVVLTHHDGDVNIDHRRTFEAVLAATRPQPGHPVREVLSFAVNSSTEWAFGTLRPFVPDVFYEIQINDKLDALKCYPDEIRAFPHPRSNGAVVGQSTMWGATVGVPFAEAFQLVRSIR